VTIFLCTLRTVCMVSKCNLALHQQVCSLCNTDTK